MIKICKANGRDELEILEKLGQRSAASDDGISEAVRAILKNVRENGDAALREYSERFDGGWPKRLEVGREEMESAFEATDGAFRDALIRASSNIRRYHEKQRTEGYEISEKEGVVLGQVSRGLDRVGLYVPGGTAAYPSTVLMNGIPAKLAGVGELIMATPPARAGAAETAFGANRDILAAAFLAGADRLFLMGGAQAIAALAYGTETVPRVDKIVGPGNIYVATAKRLLYGVVDIDMIAGPSEILIMADSRANPAFIAADMLSQAEHDSDAAAVLLTTDEGVAERTVAELAAQAGKLGRREIIEASLARYGAVIVCEGNSRMVELANQIAPEHLEIMTAEPLAMLNRIKNAGSVFCGDYAPEPLGDYYSGTNHVLPTSGTARFASPLGVQDFMKRMSYTYYSKEALEKAVGDVTLIAEREGLDAHAEAVRKRFSDGC
ncbi:MAG: histidinol dehydrogenase [Clostridiales Family XIII bacterium]|nr:histidinol dehydrogenase [Clostridiales Family XIII bacterium]